MTMTPVYIKTDDMCPIAPVLFCWLLFKLKIQVLFHTCLTVLISFVDSRLAMFLHQLCLFERFRQFTKLMTLRFITINYNYLHVDHGLTSPDCE